MVHSHPIKLASESSFTNIITRIEISAKISRNMIVLFVTPGYDDSVAMSGSPDTLTDLPSWVGLFLRHNMDAEPKSNQREDVALSFVMWIRWLPVLRFPMFGSSC